MLILINANQWGLSFTLKNKKKQTKNKREVTTEHCLSDFSSMW